MDNQTSKKIALSVLHALFKPADVRKLSKTNGVVLCGYPGCGKTTIAELLNRAFGHEILSTDQIRMDEFFKGQKHRMAYEHEQVMLARYTVYEELAKRVNKAVVGKGKVVVDGTHLDVKRFAILGAMFAKLPQKKIAVVVIRTPEWIIKSRFINLSKKQYKEWWSVYAYWRKYVKEGKAKFPTKTELPAIQIIKPRRYAIRTFDWVVDIKGIVWDVDGTLYKDTPALRDLIDRLFVKAYAEKKGLTFRKAFKKFFERYKELKSRTRVLNEIGVDGRAFVANLGTDQIDFTDFLEPDLRMRRLLRELGHLKHYIFTNASLDGTKRKLAALGLRKRSFEKIFCTHDMKWLKPDKKAFRYVVRQTGLGPNQILSVGDREATDVVPSEMVGMRTCLVYGKSKIADVCLHNHYEVAELFGKEV